MSAPFTRQHRHRNWATVAALTAIVAVMAVLVGFSVPLYRLFCATTGLGGTTRRADAAIGRVADRAVTVRFGADVAPGLPWRFEPEQREVRVRLGEEKLVFFSTENLTDEPIVGHATFNVTPAKAGIGIVTATLSSTHLEPRLADVISWRRHLATPQWLRLGRSAVRSER